MIMKIGMLVWVKIRSGDMKISATLTGWSLGNGEEDYCQVRINDHHYKVNPDRVERVK